LIITIYGHITLDSTPIGTLGAAAWFHNALEYLYKGSRIEGYTSIYGNGVPHHTRIPILRLGLPHSLPHSTGPTEPGMLPFRLHRPSIRIPRWPPAQLGTRGPVRIKVLVGCSVRVRVGVGGAVRVKARTRRRGGPEAGRTGGMAPSGGTSAPPRRRGWMVEGVGGGATGGDRRD